MTHLCKCCHYWAFKAEILLVIFKYAFKFGIMKSYVSAFSSIVKAIWLPNYKPVGIFYYFRIIYISFSILECN